MITHSKLRQQVTDQGAHWQPRTAIITSNIAVKKMIERERH